MVVAVLVLTLFAVVGLQAFLGQEGMRVTELERNVRKAEERLTLLRARRAQLGTSARLADEADKFGLVSDPDPTYLRAPADDSQASALSEVQAAHRLGTGGR